MTTTILFLIAVTCSLVAFYYQRQMRIIDELPRSAVLVNEIPEAQLSLEHGKLGFDWVLLAPRNIQERKRVEEFARTREDRGRAAASCGRIGEVDDGNST